MALSAETTRSHVILARFQTSEADAESFSSRMRDMAADTRDRGDARQFEFHVSWESPKDFLLYEEFADREHWELHHGRPELRRLRDAIAPMLVSNASERTEWCQLDGLPQRDVTPGHTTLVRFRMRAADVEPMRAEIRVDAAGAPGMVRFDLNQNATDEGAFMICARWTERDVWQKHQSDTGYLAFRERTAPFYDGPPDRTLWRPVR